MSQAEQFQRGQRITIPDGTILGAMHWALHRHYIQNQSKVLHPTLRAQTEGAPPPVFDSLGFVIYHIILKAKRLDALYSSCAILRRILEKRA
jgi:hypothetical protein